MENNIILHIIVASVLCSAIVIILGWMHYRSRTTSANRKAKLHHLLAICQDLRQQIKSATSFAELSEISFIIDDLEDGFIDYVPQEELYEQLGSLRRLAAHRRRTITLHF